MLINLDLINLCNYQDSLDKQYAQVLQESFPGSAEILFFPTLMDIEPEK